MTADPDLPAYPHDAALEAWTAPGAQPFDFETDVRRVKRLTQLVVLGAIAASLPIDFFLLGISWAQLAGGAGMGVLIAAVSIEFAFHQMLKLRKRIAYPAAITARLGSLQVLDDACRSAVDALTELFHLKGSFLALQTDSGFLSLVSLSNLTRTEAERYLRLGTGRVQDVLATAEPAILSASDDLIAQAVMSRRDKVVYVPVQCFRGVMGVVVLLGDASKSDLDDRDLLASVGMAVGVSLANLRQRDDLRTLAAVDDLTKVFNRRYFFEQLEREISASRRYAMPVSVLTFDLDQLKRINDSFGHGLGDQALRALAQRLVRYSRASDIVARLGGDEFAVILPQTDAAGAADLALRLQRSVEAEPFLSGEGRDLHLQVSFGRASFPDDADDADALLRKADGLMYAAKAARARRRRE
jgi:diguanylate cyclase (GGDEF)-like protein